MEKRIQLKVVMLGVALAALISARPAMAQEGESHCPPPPCTVCECIDCDPPPVVLCEEVTFSCDTTYPCVATQPFEFGTHKIKITANILKEFSLAIQFVPIDNAELGLRLNSLLGALGTTNCVAYDGAATNGTGGTCGFYHVVESLPVKDTDYTGDVLYKVFWDFPTLAQGLNNVRLYRAPIPTETGDLEDCTGGTGFDGEFCYTQDITGTVYPFGNTANGDPGVGGKSKGFSDYEVVDRTGNDLTAKVKIGLKKTKDAGILFDLKAVVKRNGNEVSSGELLGVPGGGKGFENAILRTIPLSFPTEAFAGGNDISIKVLVRNSCLAIPTPQPSGVARLWYDDNSESQVNELGATAALPTLYLVRGDDDEDENCDHERDRGDLSSSPGTKPKKKRDVKVQAPVPSCDGPYQSFGKWSGTVPY